MIGDLSNSGAIPTLELAARFAGARQRIIAHNIANLDTPSFIPRDVSPRDFQAALAKAVDARRDGTGGQEGELEFEGNSEVSLEPGGRLALTPDTPSGNILFPDGNNRDLERLMQANAENVAAFRVATDLLRSRYEILRTAISERV